MCDWVTWLLFGALLLNLTIDAISAILRRL